MLCGNLSVCCTLRSACMLHNLETHLMVSSGLEWGSGLLECMLLALCFAFLILFKARLGDTSLQRLGCLFHLGFLR